MAVLKSFGSDVKEQFGKSFRTGRTIFLVAYAILFVALTISVFRQNGENSWILLLIGVALYTFIPSVIIGGVSFLLSFIYRLSGFGLAVPLIFIPFFVWVCLTFGSSVSVQLAENLWIAIQSNQENVAQSMRGFKAHEPISLVIGLGIYGVAMLWSSSVFLNLLLLVCWLFLLICVGAAMGLGMSAPILIFIISKRFKARQARKS